MTIFYAVIDGDLVTRDSGRAYSHVVAVKDFDPETGEKTWKGYSWVGREDLAHRKVQDAGREGYGASQIQVVPVKTGGAAFLKGLKEELARQKKAKAQEAEAEKQQTAAEVSQEFQGQVTPAPDREEITEGIRGTIEKYDTVAEFIEKLEQRGEGYHYREACQRIINQIVRTALLNGFQIISPIMQPAVEIQDMPTSAQEEARIEAEGPEEAPDQAAADIYTDQTEHFKQIDEQRQAQQAKKTKHLASSITRTTVIRDFVEALHTIKEPYREAYQAVVNSIIEAAREAGYEIPAQAPQEAQT